MLRRRLWRRGRRRAVSLFQPNAHMSGRGERVRELAKRKRAAEVVVFSIVVVQFVLGAGERKDLSPYLFLTRRVLPSNAGRHSTTTNFSLLSLSLSRSQHTH